SYEQLRESLSPPASAVPSADPDHLLDARDVWLDALTDGPLLLDGSTAVAEAFPMLAAGLRAQTQLREPTATAHHGMVPGAGAFLDPTTSKRPVSPSALETAAACSLRWFYHYGLAVRAPEDPEYDPDAWL